MTERIRGSVRRSLRVVAASFLALICSAQLGGLRGAGQADAADPAVQPTTPAPAATAPPAPATPAAPAPAQAAGHKPCQAQIGRAKIRAVPLRGGFVQINRGARQPGSDNSDDTLEGVFGPPDRETLKHLDKAKQLSQDGRYSESLQLLDDILESSQIFFRPEDGNSSHRGLKAEARRLISGQPPEGLKAYELLFGAKAQRMLDDALKVGDMNAVAEVARRYFNTQAGYQATLLLGRYNLDHNQPLAAALCFQRLQETQTAAERLEPSLSILLAVAWARGGMNERAEEVLLELKKRDPHAMVHFGGQAVPLFGESVQALAWLTTNVGHQQASSDAAATNWALFRGNPARNASSAGGTPLLNPRWRVPTTEQQTAERAVISARQQNLDRNIPILPVMQPLAVGDVVLMRTARSLLAVDFITGKRIWEVRSQSDLQSDRVAAAGPADCRDARRRRRSVAEREIVGERHDRHAGQRRAVHLRRRGPGQRHGVAERAGSGLSCGPTDKCGLPATGPPTNWRRTNCARRGSCNGKSAAISAIPTSWSSRNYQGLISSARRCR